MHEKMMPMLTASLELLHEGAMQGGRGTVRRWRYNLSREVTLAWARIAAVRGNQSQLTAFRGTHAGFRSLVADGGWHALFHLLSDSSHIKYTHFTHHQERRNAAS